MDLNDKIVIYYTADGQTAVDVRMDGDTVWLSANQMLICSTEMKRL